MNTHRPVWGVGGGRGAKSKKEANDAEWVCPVVDDNMTKIFETRVFRVM